MYSKRNLRRSKKNLLISETLDRVSELDGILDGICVGSLVLVRPRTLSHYSCLFLPLSSYRFHVTDIWWLVWGVFLIAIIERDNLLNDDLKWFDLFRVLFELVSAFGGIGLSLGIPTVSCPWHMKVSYVDHVQENYSFVGAMRPLSKLVVIVIM